MVHPSPPQPTPTTSFHPTRLIPRGLRIEAPHFPHPFFQNQERAAILSHTLTRPEAVAVTLYCNHCQVKEGCRACEAERTRARIYMFFLHQNQQARIGRVELTGGKYWEDLPRRKRDQSVVLQLTKYECKLSLSSGNPSSVLACAALVSGCCYAFHQPFAIDDTLQPVSGK